MKVVYCVSVTYPAIAGLRPESKNHFDNRTAEEASDIVADAHASGNPTIVSKSTAHASTLRNAWQYEDYAGSSLGKSVITGEEIAGSIA
jgi:hypothetical protein